MKQGAPGKKTLFYIPLQVGPMTHTAKNLQHWLQFILVLQLATCILRIVIINDFFGGLWMLLLIWAGAYAWKQDMNITYVCFWGLGCAVNAIFDILSLLLPMVMPFLIFKVTLLHTIVRILNPFSELMGAALAWHLFRDYSVEHEEDNNPLGRVARNCDPFGKQFDDMDIAKKIGGDRFATIDKVAGGMAAASGKAMDYGTIGAKAAAGKVAEEVAKKEAGGENVADKASKFLTQLPGIPGGSPFETHGKGDAEAPPEKKEAPKKEKKKETAKEEEHKDEPKGMLQSFGANVTYVGDRIDARLAAASEAKKNMQKACC